MAYALLVPLAFQASAANAESGETNPRNRGDTSVVEAPPKTSMKPAESTATAPGAPAFFTATALSDVSIRLDWQPPADTGSSALTGYEIEWTSDGLTWTDLVDLDDTELTYTDTNNGLSAGTVRVYRIYAVNLSGPGEANFTSAVTFGDEPGPPTNLVATADGQTAIDLSWDAPTYIGNSSLVGYKIEVKGLFTWDNLVQNTNSTSTTYRHTGLTPDTTVIYRVLAINGSGEGTPSGAVGATTAPEGTPGPPTNLTAMAISSTAIELSWDAPADEGDGNVTGYRIARRLLPIGSWMVIATNTNSTSTTHTDTGVEPDTSYQYRVSAINSAGTGDWSATANATTRTGPTLGAPTNLTAEAIDETTIELKWEAPSETGGSAINGYVIQTSVGDTTRWTHVAHTGTTDTEYVHEGVQPGTTLYYRVLALNADGRGPPSKAARVTTPIGPAAPGPPTNLTTFVQDQTTIELEWDAPADTGSSAVAGYRIQTSVNDTTNWTHVANTDSDPYYLHEGVQPGATLYYRVFAINAAGVGPPSEVASATTTVSGTPGAPTDLTADANDATTIELKWETPTDVGNSAITGYRIEVSEDGGGSWADLEDDTESAQTVYEHTGLQPGTTRHYRVSAINGSGTGPPSDVAFATTTGGGTRLPGRPTNLVANADGRTTIVLEWDEPADPGSSPISGYRIEVSRDGGASWNDRVANTNSTNTTYRHTGLQPGSTRHYRVSAINANGTGTASGIAHATTPTGTLGSPTSLTAEARGSSQINLSWNAPTDDGGSAITGYRIEISSNGGSSWVVLVANTGSTTTTYAHAGLAAGTTRHYRVSAINANGTGPVSNIAHATTGGDVTGSPSNLTATANGSSQIDLAWAAPANQGGSLVTGYRIEVATPDNPTWATLVDNTGSTATTYSHTNLPPASTWSYRVAAIGSSGTSPASKSATATTDPAVPDPPTELTAVARGSSWIEVSWKAPVVTGGVEITGYRIEVYDEERSLWTMLEADTRNTATQYHHLDLDPGSTWNYRVSAINEAGVGTPSEVARATTDAVEPDAPTGLVATAKGTSQIDLEWRSPDYTGGAPIKGYRIESFRESDAQWQVLVDNTSSTATTYSHTGLDPASTRHYRVAAINSAGAGPPSSMASATTDPVVPDEPAGLHATANGARRIDLSWRAPEYDGGARVTGYMIEVSENAGAVWRDLVTDTRSTATAFSDVDLLPGSTRHYRVSAMNAAGSSQPSDVAFATTDATPPDPPGQLTAQARDHSQIDLSWEAPDFDGGSRITGHRIEVSDNGRDWTDLVANTGSTNTFHTHSGLPPATLRFYRVSAINEIGTGGVSNVASATTDATVPDPPTDLVATPVAPGQIDLSWAAPEYDGGAPVTSYRIEVSRDGTDWTDLEASTGESLTSYSHIGLAPRSTRHYRVSAINIAGAGMPSNVASASTDDPVERAGRVNQALLPHFTATMTTSTLSAIAGRVEALAFGTPEASHSANAGLASLAGRARQNGSVRDFSTARLLDGMSFVLPLGDRTDGRQAARSFRPGTWGSVASHRMGQPDDGTVRWEGDMLSTHIGADMRVHRGIVAGVAGTRSSGNYEFTDATGEREVEGTYEARMTSVNPYLGWISAEMGMAAWVAGGLGWGEVAIEDELESRRASDSRIKTGALGASRILLSSGVASLRLRAEGWLSEVEVDGGEMMDSLELQMRRARLALQWSQAHRFATGQQVSVLLEGGMRHDSGDGTNGTGMEFGAGLRYLSASRRLRMEGHGRVLATSNAGYEEWGISGSIHIDPPGGSGGLSMRIAPAWGEAASGIRRLWETGVSDKPAGDMAPKRGRVNAEVEYGLASFQGIPYSRFHIAEGGTWAIATGVRYETSRMLALRIEGSRNESADGLPRHRLTLGGRLRF